MSGRDVAEYILAAIFFVVGIRAGLAALRSETRGEPPGIRFLVAVHDAARAGFWLSLGALFLGFGILEDDEELRQYAVVGIVPIVMAGIRLLAAGRLARQ